MENSRRTTKTVETGLSLKSILKTLKLNEPTISTVLGGVVVLVIAFTLINSFRNNSSQNKITQQASQTAQEQPATPKTHKVENGDNLWKIAEKYYKSGYNWVDIAKANKIANASIITAGQELVLPEVEPKQVTIAQTSDEKIYNTTFGEAIVGDNYTVAKGDHLWGIAVRAYGDGYKWVDIANVNNLENPDVIYKDQKLSIPRN